MAPPRNTRTATLVAFAFWTLGVMGAGEARGQVPCWNWMTGKPCPVEPAQLDAKTTAIVHVGGVELRADAEAGDWNNPPLVNVAEPVTVTCRVDFVIHDASLVETPTMQLSLGFGDGLTMNKPGWVLPTSAHIGIQVNYGGWFGGNSTLSQSPISEVNVVPQADGTFRGTYSKTAQWCPGGSLCHRLEPEGNNEVLCFANIADQDDTNDTSTAYFRGLPKQVRADAPYEPLAAPRKPAIPVKSPKPGVPEGQRSVAVQIRGSQVFTDPLWNGKRVDMCLVWGGQCGAPAATEFCKRSGFAEASDWKPANDIGDQTPTVVLSSGQVCSDASCDGFTSITCSQ